MLSRFPGGIRPGKPLFPLVDRALGALDVVLQEQLKDALNKMVLSYPQVAGFINYWKLARDGTFMPTTDLINRKLDFLNKDPLHWALIEMQFGQKDTLRSVDEHVIFSILNDHLSNNGDERKRISERLYRKISMASDIHEMLSTLRLYRPMYKVLNLPDYAATEDTLAWRHIRKYHDTHKTGRRAALAKEFTLQLGVLGEFLQRFMKAPLPSG